jgi:ribonucleotide reductase beta subunit family protein with ferritin-like domain
MIPIPEIQYTYAFQSKIEITHSLSYGLFIESLINNEDKKSSLVDVLTEKGSIKKIRLWADKYIGGDSNKSFAHKIVANCCIEGILFAGAFAIIYWLSERGIMNGLSYANELISRDEDCHTRFGARIYGMILDENKLSYEELTTMVGEIVELSKEFIYEAIPKKLEEMNKELYLQYTQFMSDNLLVLLNHKPMFNVKNPFHFVKRINLPNKTNFFERGTAEYQQPVNIQSDILSTYTYF